MISFKNSRKVHSQIIQIIEVKMNMQKVYDNLVKKINAMSPTEQKKLADKMKQNRNNKQEVII